MLRALKNNKKRSRAYMFVFKVLTCNITLRACFCLFLYYFFVTAPPERYLVRWFFQPRWWQKPVSGENTSNVSNSSYPLKKMCDAYHNCIRNCFKPLIIILMSHTVVFYCPVVCNSVLTIFLGKVHFFLGESYFVYGKQTTSCIPSVKIT